MTNITPKWQTHVLLGMDYLATFRTELVSVNLALRLELPSDRDFLISFDLQCHSMQHHMLSVYSGRGEVKYCSKTHSGSLGKGSINTWPEKPL